MDNKGKENTGNDNYQRKHTILKKRRDIYNKNKKNYTFRGHIYSSLLEKFL